MSFLSIHFPRWVWSEVCFRIFIFVIFLITEELSPYHRVIQPEEAWLYRFPNKVSIVPSQLLWLILVIATLTVIAVVFGYNNDLNLAICAIGVPTLALPLNGIITNIIKVTVGRPRPDYLERCYGPEYLTITEYTRPCIGAEALVFDGRKSFPSGHSSMSFCGFGFLFLYIAAQLKAFSTGRGRSVRLITSFVPLIAAALVAISRTCDYHHHWQDISVGSLLGFCVVYAIYRQYFPALADPTCDKPDVSAYEQGASEPVSGKLYGRRTLSSQDNLNCIKTV